MTDEVVILRESWIAWIILAILIALLIRMIIQDFKNLKNK